MKKYVSSWDVSMYDRVQRVMLGQLDPILNSSG
jgi:hypothetical protein